MPLATRMEFGRELIEIAKTNDKFVLINPDTKSHGLENFGVLYPGRAYNFGIAEQNMFGAAAGFASCGHKVFVTTFAVFASMRACEQIRTFICYPKLNVTIVASHTGLQVGPDGATHMALEDISIMRSFPNMTILQPSDAVSAKAAAQAAVDFEGPLYVRLHRDPVPDIHDPATYRLVIGKATTVRDYGNDVALLVSGILLGKALAAAEQLNGQGIKCKVIDFPTIKPLDDNAVVSAAGTTGAVITVEDHTVLGGLGSAVAEVLGEKCPTRMKRIGIQDAFGESGNPELLYKDHGMTADDIVAAAVSLQASKKQAVM
ncbi:MAG: transketolase family protein [Negativicutes bacterium]